jgi:hypothetical protein
MAKRKKTATVQLKLRIREELRQKLERQAHGREVSLNSEMVRRLENSFESGTTDLLVKVLTGSPSNAKLLAMIASVLQATELLLKNDKQRTEITAAAIKKVIEAHLSDRKLDDADFPDLEKPKSADSIAHHALLVHRRLGGIWDEKHDGGQFFSGDDDGEGR